MNQSGLRCTPLVREVLTALRHAGAEVEAWLESSVEPMGLSLAKMGALHTLVEADEPIPLGQLAERLCCVKSNVTQLVDRLEADRLVRRVPDPADRRSVRAEVTEEGRARFAAAMRARQAAEAELLAGFDEAELEQLAGWCRRVASHGGSRGAHRGAGGESGGEVAAEDASDQVSSPGGAGRPERP